MKKPLLTIKQIEQKLKKHNEKHRKQKLKEANQQKREAKKAPVKAPEDSYDLTKEDYLYRAKKCLDDIKKPGDLWGLRYRKKTGYFTNYKDSCGFDPITGDGHSYRWYALTKVIKGKLVLNTYGYSNQTSKHISKIRRLFEILGLKYLEIKAPKGLQDLDIAALHNAIEYGRAKVEFKHARIKSNRRVKRREKLINNLAKIGVKIPKKSLVEAEKQAEAEREKRLEENRTKAKKKKLEAYLENEIAFRDYKVVPKDWFGNASAWVSKEQGVHQFVDMETMKDDVNNAIHDFHRDGFNQIIFYI